ncbi:hypothetical protein LEP1GSC043_2614 [Leptospira weilii str. Ecochallenge]|uniref:Uncharacterized protein n=1 Tax=Leptospira weilii str. Ecochallenge TaxID=1049986 RepID=N1U2Z8_9LEPT|nr:hypothetical protein [Leptospira weilii]EMY13387.1 hypothetical protein LEP1GSC043_2614 [Leptospira weilii str. Ecochallenge]
MGTDAPALFRDQERKVNQTRLSRSKKKRPKALLHSLKNTVDKKSSIKIKKFYLALLPKTNFLNQNQIP